MLDRFSILPLVLAGDARTVVFRHGRGRNHLHRTHLAVIEVPNSPKKHYRFHNCFFTLRSICCDGQSQSQISHAGGGGGGGGVSGIEASEATSAAVSAEQHLGPATTVNGSLAPPQMV